MKKNYAPKMIFIIAMLFLSLGQVFAQTCGDVNNSNNVDIVDALLIAQKSVGPVTVEFNSAVADVNNDGTINIVDALMVAQYYVQLIDKLSCAPVVTTPPTPVPNVDPIFSGGPYTLNGSSDFISVPAGITANVQDFTIACWVNLSSKTNWVRIFDFGNSTDVFMMLTPQSGSTGFPYFCITTTGNSGEQGINGISALATGSWQHIAIVKNGTTAIMYINRQEVARNSNMTLSPKDLGSTANNYIGRSQWSNDPYLNGFVANFMIYNQALNATQISVLGTNPPPVITPAPTPTPGLNVTHKIMPLGDSITDGIPVAGGYRIKLWANVEGIGKKIDFVGSLSNGPASLPDKNHEGHSGWRIDQLDTNINGWMDNYKPEIVLLHIGTNDITQGYDLANAPNRVGTLVDKICAKLPAGGKVYVAKVIPISYSSGDQAAVSFNNQLATMVQTKKNQGKPVFIVDMHSALTVSDLSDQVHPNLNGYNKMADVWFNAIKGDL